MEQSIGAYIIHVPGDARRERNVARLQEFTAALSIPTVVYPGIVPTDPGPMRTAGEWGCYQSHLSCLEQAASAGHDFVLVFEDDAVPSQTPDEFAAFFEMSLAEGWDFLHLGHSYVSVFRSWDEEMIARPLHRIYGELFGLLCYAVRSRDLASYCIYLRELAQRDPTCGGGVGMDGGLCMLAWERGPIVRVAPAISLVNQLPGIKSQLRETSTKRRIKEYGKLLARPLIKALRARGYLAPRPNPRPASVIAPPGPDAQSGLRTGSPAHSPRSAASAGTNLSQT